MTKKTSRHWWVGGPRVRGRGQTLAEFALVLPVLMILLLMAVDFGRLFFTYVETHNAAREAVSFASGNPTDTAGITARALQETNVQGQRGEGAPTVTSSCVDQAGTVIACADASGGGGAGNRITVAVARRFTFLTPLINGFFSNNLQLTASATAAVLGYASSDGGTPPGQCAGPTVASFTVSIGGLKVDVDPSASRPNSGVCEISGFNWAWGDGSTDVGTWTGASHTYAASGTYLIKLVVTNQGGSLGQNQNVTVSSGNACIAPVAQGSVLPTSGWVASNGNNATDITFDGTPSTNMTVPACHPVWDWDFGDGSAHGTAATVVHNYKAPMSGKQPTVVLKATNDAGTSTWTFIFPDKLK